MTKVDILQLVITNAAISGVGLTKFSFTKKSLRNCLLPYQ